ncbi:hypothetical protein ACFLYU_00080 [Candidatus Dependentiae bacterium]
MKKFICIKLLAAFSVNLLMVPIVNCGKKRKYRKNSGYKRCYRRDKRSLNHRKFMYGVSKKEKKIKSKQRKVIEKLKVAQEKNKLLQNITEKFVYGYSFMGNKNIRQKSLKTGKSRKALSLSMFSKAALRLLTSKPLVFVLFLFFLFLRAKAQDDVEYFHCEEGSYFFSAIHIRSGDYYPFEDIYCWCELYTDPIWGAVSELLVCEDFPMLYSDHCKPGEYTLEMFGHSDWEILAPISCDCENDVYLDCNGFFTVKCEPRSVLRRFIDNRKNQKSVLPNNTILFCPLENESDAINLPALIASVGGAGIALGALCCSPFVCIACVLCLMQKKKINKMVSEVEKERANKNTNFTEDETSEESDSQTETETETDTETSTDIEIY